ncbi:phosphoethanolamine transferase [Xylophilus sp. GOD-11R]|uniref:phosphoethanolamine transferase n=1 Tax=Xylophilus sp. GOD-11R TaxID=3089814 RepID=UPI00298CCBFE|nr:sulfatase-like hydrolase/transferase [Xylophilus sp. GOD-11R]WPB57834.1 sulfatase-like hydrolase/transferase [Xylophilus sp. GOD-11R]
MSQAQLASASTPTDLAAVPPAGRLLGRLRQGPLTPRVAALVIALWVAFTGNLSLWNSLRQLAGVGEMGHRPLLLGLSILLAVFCATATLLTCFAGRRIFKPAMAVLLVLAGVVQHFMLAYGIVIDPGMVANALQTNFTEARDLFGFDLLAQCLLVAGPPMVWLWRLRLSPQRGWAAVWRNLAITVTLLAATIGVTLSIYRELAPLLRNHLELRFAANPVAPLASTISAVTKPLRKHRNGPLVVMTAGAALGPSYAAAGTASHPPLFLLVVGETARADHFGLNGYARDTTPGLAQRDVVSFTQVRSCGTNTLHSVPCMFSPLGKAGWEGRKADTENLLDVIQAAGLAVLWVDNQAGCKSVCDRVPNASTGTAFAPAADAARALCADGECLDRVMLAGLDERIAALPAERRARGVVLVMHMMGSHGPAYWRRSAPDTKRFQPECATQALAQCDQASLINVYDNSIAETDRFLSAAIDWLQARHDRFAPAMLYLSDHGESLGEYGMFLHGVPYAFAPEVQKHVPMVLWIDPAFASRGGTDRACLNAHRDVALSHDNLYPSVLGLMDVTTPTYKPALDAFASCRARATAFIKGGPAPKA